MAQVTAPWSTLDDAALLRASRDDPEAFGELVRRHQAVVFGAAFRVVGDRQVAEDLAQEAFLRAFQASGEFRGEGTVGAWLYRIAKNLALNQVSRRREHPGDLPDLPAKTDPESEYLRTADIRAVRQAVASLPAPLREPLVLREYQGLSYDEIGRRLGLATNTVRTRIHRGRKAVQEALSERDHR
ncbi:MAG: RNA polymerase sigma-H factor [Acidimicrobiia bacterium]|nr:MAG: RNA polymerase sigma-H factor [Acidimicrobiia bacterium]